VSEREPIFNAPRVVVGVLGAFVAVHLVRSFLPEEQGAWLAELLAFIPARLAGRAADFPGGDVAMVTQFFTHVFVHGDITHLVINSAWFLAFGSSVARRTGAVRFLAFFFLCGIGGALFFLALNPGISNSMVGASGAISGLMGAAFRYVFRALSEGDTDGLAGETRQAPLESLGATLGDRRVLIAVAGWTLLNVLAAWGASGLLQGVSIAWEAHLGGFYMGLFTFGFFDRAAPAEPIHHDAADGE